MMEKTYVNIISPTRPVRVQSRTQSFMDAARKAWQKVQERSNNPDRMDRIVFYTALFCGLLGLALPWGMS